MIEIQTVSMIKKDSITNDVQIIDVEIKKVVVYLFKGYSIIPNSLMNWYS